jgi:hypothetical protein
MRFKTLALRIIPFVVYLICLIHVKINKKSTPFIRRTLTASSASEGDPLIMGLSGQAIGFRGRSGAWYSTISSRSLQWNMRLHSYDNCPKNANNFVSGFGLTLFQNRKPSKRIDVNVINPYSVFPLETSCGGLEKSHCLGAGSLEIAIDDKRYVVGGDYRFDDAPGRVLVFNTNYNCKRRWRASNSASGSETVAPSGEGNPFNTQLEEDLRISRRLGDLDDYADAYSYIESLGDSMINESGCKEWIQERRKWNDLFQQPGRHTTIIIHTESISLQLEYKQQMQPCTTHSLDAWIISISPSLLEEPWEGLLGETKDLSYIPRQKEQEITDRAHKLKFSKDKAYEVTAPNSFRCKACISK